MKLFLMTLVASAVLGHDLYLRPQQFELKPGETGTVEFHNGEAFPKSQVPPVLERLRGAKVISSSAAAEITNIRIEGSAGVGQYKAPAANGFLLVAHTVPNFIELPAGKFEEYLSHEHLNSISKWRKKNNEAAKAGREFYSKYVKAILHTGGVDAFVTQPVGQEIEFVPVVDPASLKPGQKLKVQILFRGKPAAGLHVEATSASGEAVKERQVGRTDSNGKIAIPLDVPGLWKLHAIHMQRRSDTSKAEWESHWASLTFEVKP